MLDKISSTKYVRLIDKISLTKYARQNKLDKISSTKNVRQNMAKVACPNKYVKQNLITSLENEQLNQNLSFKNSDEEKVFKCRHNNQYSDTQHNDIQQNEICIDAQLK
jgi:hypothetical protein